ncbi:MAG: hypothetical protein Q9M19_05955 [Mariprofundaceae bacterium]|nr:hypothetical protein [Mariprofundaceae bacterium]
MPEPLKNAYNKTFFTSLVQVMQTEYPSFAADKFLDLLWDAAWEEKELKQRMRHITCCLHHCLPDYIEALPILKAASSHFKHTFEHMFFPDYVECYGLEHYDVSMDALEHFTQYSSAEFAIRPFILRYPKASMAQLQAWAIHPHEHVRRLASEGCRPRLPWAMQLPLFVQDPEPVITILEMLKGDASLYVRRSVANNLNDISKDHEVRVFELAKQWSGVSKDTDWLVKHACRTLLKQGHVETLALFGFEQVNHVQTHDFQVSHGVEWGGEVHFSCQLLSKQMLGKLRLEFAIHFQKANGTMRSKVFKIAESDYQEKSKTIQKKFSFKAISTRKYYAGEHRLSLLINGQTQLSKPFVLYAENTK